MSVILLGVALLNRQGYLFPVRAQAAQERLVFDDVSRQAGISDNRVPGLDLGIGQAWGDYNNDDWVDLYVTDPEGPNTLYRNNGNGTFSQSPLNAQVALPDAHSNGAVFADFDNDGWRDLYVAAWGADTLFRNESGERFVDVTEKAGIRESANTKTASWGDFDNDGYLDLYLANWSCYPECGRTLEGDSDILYHNNGDGTFTNVSDYLGGGLNGAGFVASFTDYDNDGDLDIYLVNDEFVNPIGNKLWRNDGPGCQGWCFTEVAQESGAESKVFGMGLAVGDYDNDGDIDFYFSNVGPMELLQNQGDGTFRDVALEAGVQTPESIGWGAVLIDYDNDGWRDLYLAVADTTNHRDIGANKLFHNNRDGSFTLVNCGNAAADVRMSLGVATADYDHDGWVDLVVGNMDEGYRLYRNTSGAGSSNHWLVLELIGGGPVNRDAVGARVIVTTPDGNTQLQEVINGASVGAGNDLVLSYGLGAEQTAQLHVRWPDGREQVFSNVRVDHRYRLEYPQNGESSLQVLPGPLASTSIQPASSSLDSSAIVTLVLLIGASLLFTASWEMSAPGRRLAQGVLVLGGLLFSTVLLFQPDLDSSPLASLLPQDQDARLQALMQQAGVQPPTNPLPPSTALVKLGESLFWDPELSGNRDITCATCHHPLKATGDNLSISIGTGGVGLGEAREIAIDRRELVPRNAPPIFNLGYTEWTVLFWDGRVSGTLEDGFETPASNRLPDGLENLLAAQAMFPVTSRDEMRGLRGDVDIFGQKNELAMIPDYTSRAIWNALMARLLAIPGYVELFRAAYPEVPIQELGFQHAANALAAYQSTVFTFEDSPFDRYIRGDTAALTTQAREGALLFYGEAGCAECHSGVLLTDQAFYNLAVPQIGPGKGREQPLDLGRARETGNDCDRFAFRTPPLRNVAITGPWMHNGAFTSLEAAVRHHLNPVEGLRGYDPNQLTPEMAATCQEQPEVINAILASYIPGTMVSQLSDTDIQAILSFLDALTSPAALDLAHTIPDSVPSGLAVGGN
jgi:cytochrome c peroxidase